VSYYVGSLFLRNCFILVNIVKAKKTNKQIKFVVKRVKNHLKMAIIPHKKNDYRPHLIRSYGLVAIVFVAIGLQLGYNGATTGDILGNQSDITISSLLEHTNEARVRIGVKPLLINDKLNKAAYLKAQDMFEKQYWAHDAPDGTQPWKWFGDVNYNYNEAGENLAKNFTSTSAVMIAWMDSPEHKANIIKSSYSDVGFAVVSGEMDKKPISIIVALYGLPADDTIVATQSSFSDASKIESVNIFTQFAIATKSITPAVIISLLLIAIAVTVSIIAHTHRHRLPKSLRKSWRHHHGLYKVAGLLLLAVVTVFMYGGGQI